MSCPNPNCRKHVITRYIRKKGKIIYPKHAQFFSFCVETVGKEKSYQSSKTVA